MQSAGQTAAHQRMNSDSITCQSISDAVSGCDGVGQTECSAQGCPLGPDLPTSCLVPSPVISTSPAVTGTLRHPARPVSRPLKWTVVRLTEASGILGPDTSLSVCLALGLGRHASCLVVRRLLAVIRLWRLRVS